MRRSLAIQGSEIKKEAKRIIQILRTLGGKNTCGFCGIDELSYYYINDGSITSRTVYRFFDDTADRVWFETYKTTKLGDLYFPWVKGDLIFIDGEFEVVYEAIWFSNNSIIYIMASGREVVVDPEEGRVDDIIICGNSELDE